MALCDTAKGDDVPEVLLEWAQGFWDAAGVAADAVRTSRARYGAQSTAKGLLCTNWGGGRIERNVPIVAELSWNLYQ